jgi:hypothetical protein
MARLAPAPSAEQPIAAHTPSPIPGAAAATRGGAGAFSTVIPQGNPLVGTDKELTEMRVMAFHPFVNPHCPSACRTEYSAEN